MENKINYLRCIRDNEGINRLTNEGKKLVRTICNIKYFLVDVWLFTCNPREHVKVNSVFRICLRLKSFVRT